ncbi:MAG: MmcQ/YjbR family DNA-binding protein [Myxococcaceae bacterium]|nr:MmcQ/YjbR family DNA-binding protein [Myxococcaceae bacterium]
MSQSNSLDNPHELALRDFSLGYPGAQEDFPWGHRAIKVKGKAFLFMGHEAGGLGLSVKLPHSNAAALMMPFATPTGYGLGKSGWVSASFAKGEKPPLELLRQWIDESYRAVAPKTLVAQIGSGAKAAGPKKAAPVKKRTAAKKSGARKQAGTRAKQAR